MTWGGARPGSGKKPKDAATRALHGSRDRRPKRPKLPPGPLKLLPAPNDMPTEQAVVWNELAPHACRQRTLSAETLSAFRDLCEAIILKRSLLERIERDGLTYMKISVDGAGVEHSEIKAHPLLTQHRGMMTRVEAGLVRFRLAPIGKELTPPETPKDEWAEFDHQEESIQ